MSDAGSQFPHLSVEGLIFPFPIHAQFAKLPPTRSTFPPDQFHGTKELFSQYSFVVSVSYVHSLLEKEQLEKSITTQQYEVSTTPAHQPEFQAAFVVIFRALFPDGIRKSTVNAEIMVKSIGVR